MIPTLREGRDEHPLRGVSQRRQFPKLPSIAPRMDTSSAIAVLIFSTPEPYQTARGEGEIIWL
mgnify:CR=1 FL=1